VAFNKRAADEMVERTPDLGANIRTLNSLGLAITNGTGGFAAPARTGRRQVIEERAVRTILDALIEVRRAPNTDPFVPYLDGLRAIRLGLEAPKSAESSFDAPGLAEIFPKYVELLADRALIDFDGQLYEAVRVLLTEPRCRERAQLLARHLLVDEFQDLTPVHMLLLRLMAAPSYDVFGVGDDDQVIYGFGGATPRFLLDFGDFFPGAAAHALEVNYRCPPGVVGAASMLLSYNHERIPKEVRPAPGRDASETDMAVQLIAKTEEAPACLDLVQSWHKDDIPYERMAVLARVNAALLPVQVLFHQADIPARRPLDASILDRTGIRTALAYLRIALDPGRISRADVTETIRRPSRRIARNVVEMLTKRAHTSIDDIQRLAMRLSGNDSAKLLAYADDLALVVSAASQGDAAKVFRTIRVRVGLGEAMDELDSVRREADRSTHADDLVALEQVAAMHTDPSTFIPWLRDVLSHRDTGTPGVEVSTIHRVKGREWDRVVVFGVDDGLLPHRLAEDVAEERRLLHVAITRCRQRVVVVADADDPSPFLDELDGSRARTPPPPKRARQLTIAGPPAETAPRKGGVELPPEALPLRDALRDWRRQVSASAKVPAFTVLHDAHLDGIAKRAPRSLRELATCPGIGPAKLEKWGDEILAVVDAVQPP
jgi:DNA helicase-2/ATP-dependent DNA helicase PcrA